jgi:hypothetical protein
MKKINEATSTDLPVIFKLRDDYGWKVGDTLLYRVDVFVPALADWANVVRTFGAFI